VTVYDSVKIKGAGSGQSVIQALPATATATRNMFYCPPGSNPEFEGLTLKSHATSNAGYSVIAIKHEGSYALRGGAKAFDVVFDGWYYGMQGQERTKYLEARFLNFYLAFYRL
jgi:hypothetical protein